MVHHPAGRLLLLVMGLLSVGLPTRAAPAKDPLHVEFVQVVSRKVGMDVRLTGTLEPLVSVDIGFRQGGRIVALAVNEGDSFTKGEVLARIDPLQLQQSLNAAMAMVASARATEEQARQAADRAQAMLDRGVGTRADRDNARQMLSAAETGTRQAQSALDQARRSVEDTELLAPFDGVVTARSGEPGQVVGPAQVVLSLAAYGGIEAVFLTPDMPHLDKAMGTQIVLQALDVDAPPMTGTITEISPLIDVTTGSVRLRARVTDAPDDMALLGASVRGTMIVDDNAAREVPWTALTSTGGRPAVWVVGADGISELREVEIARFNSGTVLLSSGVEPGETVVGAGSQLLFPGRPVVAAGGGS